MTYFEGEPNNGFAFFFNISMKGGTRKMNNQEYLTETEVADLTKFSIQTLRNHRHMSRGIPYLKINRAVRYRPEDVKGYMERVCIDPSKN